jgi:hypothetical protein
MRSLNTHCVSHTCARYLQVSLSLSISQVTHLSIAAYNHQSSLGSRIRRFHIGGWSIPERPRRETYEMFRGPYRRCAFPGERGLTWTHFVVLLIGTNQLNERSVGYSVFFGFVYMVCFPISIGGTVYTLSIFPQDPKPVSLSSIYPEVSFPWSFSIAIRISYSSTCNMYRSLQYGHGAALGWFPYRESRTIPLDAV